MSITIILLLYEVFLVDNLLTYYLIILFNDQHYKKLWFEWYVIIKVEDINKILIGRCWKNFFYVSLNVRRYFSITSSWQIMI